ncbi:hypothetical protein ASZ90_010823 [hydrocarbon metagenome]|uniref:Uncharacterized protein n=1 Tax=hydrocarbon metagenome TaxID=938273 RepID=A0A0W8FEX8_9ZZZZ
MLPVRADSDRSGISCMEYLRWFVLFDSHTREMEIPGSCQAVLMSAEG